MTRNNRSKTIRILSEHSHDNETKEPKLTPKSKGALTALAFAYEAGRRGAIISEPIGDDARYDLIIDNRDRLSESRSKQPP